MSPCILVFNLNNPRFCGSPDWNGGEKMAFLHFNFSHIFFATNEHLKYGGRLQGSLWRLTFSHAAAPCHHTWCSLYLVPDVSERARVGVHAERSLTDLTRGTYSVTKQSKPFGKVSHHYELYLIHASTSTDLCTEVLSLSLALWIYVSYPLTHR